MVNQGEIITITGIDIPMLVISKNTYNKTGMLIACPIVKKKMDYTLSVHIDTPALKGYVICDSPRQFNWKKRGIFSKGSIPYKKLIQVLDMFNSIFDYV